MYRCLKVCFGYCVLLATSSAFASCARSADEPPEVTRTESGNDTHRDTINRSQAEITPSAWDEAAASIRHLAPSVFTEAPAAVRNHLIEDGCTVPQAYNDSTRHNVISGEFAAPGQIDWAALCTRGDSAGIVIVWGGPVRCPSPIASGKNKNVLQGIGEGRIGYSRAISAASMAYILEHAKAYDGPAPPSRDHSGIDDAFLGKASVVRLCSDGQWFTLQGAD